MLMTYNIIVYVKFLERMKYMKNSKLCPIINIISLIVGFAVYYFISNNNFDQLYFQLFIIATAVAGLLSTLTLVTTCSNYNINKISGCSFLCCRTIAMISAPALVLLSFLALLLEPLRNIIFYISVAGCSALLTSLIASIACFLYSCNNYSNFACNSCECCNKHCLDLK